MQPILFSFKWLFNVYFSLPLHSESSSESDTTKAQASEPLVRMDETPEAEN